MQFGSDEMKDLLLRAESDESMSEKAMIELFETVRMYTLSKIKKGFMAGEVGYGSKGLTTELVNLQDYDDIINDAYCNVLISLDKFIINLKEKEYEAAQRQAWLRKIVYNTIAKYLVKQNKLSKTSELTEFSGDEEKKEIAAPENEDVVQYEETFKCIIRASCSAKTNKPEKILAFIFNFIIFREIMGHKKNGCAKETSDYMNGKKLHTLKNAMVDIIKQVFNVKISNEDIEPLVLELGDEIPEGKGNNICEITPKLVADWTNRIKTHIFKYKAEIYGEGGGMND